MCLSEVERYLGLGRGALSRTKLPEPDAIIGPVNDDGTIPRGTIRGWNIDTVNTWNAQRPGRGARTDLRS